MTNNPSNSAARKADTATRNAPRRITTMPIAAVATVIRSIAASSSIPGVMSSDEKWITQLRGRVVAMTANSTCIVGALRRSIASAMGTSPSQRQPRIAIEGIVGSRARRVSVVMEARG
ncbi:hypothetical protein GN331_13745 [Lysobacter sp. HX-5-24]|uniref:Uncharacterized protein n=1 Tax=Noviluteimonas gilva TaxID=2682097 RepID=A0A7C9LMS8_9GAMM|nr:hypothetical protein [Lysobacter gilvus]